MEYKKRMCSFFLSQASGLLQDCAWMCRVRVVCATVCEGGRWCISRNHLSTLGFTAGGLTMCMCVCEYIYVCVFYYVLHSRQRPDYKDKSPDIASGLCH